MSSKLAQFIQIAICACALNLGQTGFVQEDAVIVRHPSGKTVKRRGVITSWTGSELSLKSGTRTRAIDNDRIVEIQTSWNTNYTEGKQLLAKGDYREAAEKFRKAVAEEKRQWAQLIIRAALVRAYSASDQNAAAVEEFAKIIGGDPQTRFMHLIPLPWSGSVGNAALKSQAKTWLESSNPVLQLIGASWLTSGVDRSLAIQKLKKLAQDEEPIISRLAAAQILRTEITAVDEQQVSKWEQKISQMPESERAGPYFVLGLAQARLGQNQRAAINLMKIPILFPDQNALSAAALYKCANVLHNDGRTEEARILWNELLTDHPNSIWAQQVDTGLLQSQNN